MLIIMVSLVIKTGFSSMIVLLVADLKALLKIVYKGVAE